MPAINEMFIGTKATYFFIISGKTELWNLLCGLKMLWNLQDFRQGGKQCIVDWLELWGFFLTH